MGLLGLEIKQLDTDAEGWTEVVLLRSTGAGADRDEPEGETIGFVQMVEETKDGPHTWYDFRPGEAGGQARRFTSLETGLLALTLRHVSPDEMAQRLRWP